MPVYSIQRESYSRQFKRIHPFVRQCGNDRRGRWSIRNRKLLDYLLIYMKEGEGVFSLEDKNYAVKQGDLFCVPPEIISSLRGTSSTMVCPFVHFDLVYRDPGSHWDFVIPENTISLEKWENLRHPPLEEGSVFHALPGLHRPDSSARIGSLIEEICHDSAMMLPYYSVFQTGRMFEILGLLLKDRLYKCQDKPSSADRLAGLGRFIRQRLRDLAREGQDITVKDCADFCNLSESYLRKIFPAVFAMSPRDYIVNVRMQYAKELLQNPGLTITEVALACGYESIHAFSKMFRKHTGLTPSAYRTGLL